ncbi:MAG: serine--tRNA ligase, partial [Candidatus Thorarchaeota archaeon]
MLHIKFIRENAELIKQDLVKRRDDAKLEAFERLLDLDSQVRELQRTVQDLRTQRNRVSREIGELKKAGEDTTKLTKEANRVNKSIKETEDKTAEMRDELLAIQMRIPNILHESVPYGEGEEDNEIVK